MSGEVLPSPPPRSASKQGPPHRLLDRFPVVGSGVVPKVLWRVHVRRPGTPDEGAFWFNSATEGDDPEGRFDVPVPHGTFYAAEATLVALYETVGVYTSNGVTVPHTAVEDRVLSELDVDTSGLRLAELDDVGVTRFGATRELGSGALAYTVTSAWACEFRRAGFDGIRYPARFTPGPHSALALFGEAGNRAVPEGWKRRQSWALALMCYLLGIKVERISSDTVLSRGEPSLESLDPA